MIRGWRSQSASAAASNRAATSAKALSNTLTLRGYTLRGVAIPSSTSNPSTGGRPARFRPTHSSARTRVVRSAKAPSETRTTPCSRPSRMRAGLF
jgi:hypothetical protein